VPGAKRLEVDICIIGAGTGGLVTAAAAAQLGARTVLFERHKMGGDCLNYGCVPSKALLAAAKAAKTVRTAGRLGIETAPPAIDYSAVMRHVHGAIAAIAPHDSAERFEGLGVKVVRAEARFIGPQEIAGGGFIIRARRFVIAAGSSPAVPPIPGLGEVAYLTNETVFANTVLLEMAQAHRLLGSQVTVLEAAQILSKDDPELVGQLRDRLEADGIAIRDEAEIRQAEKSARGIAVILKQGGTEERIEGTHLLVAAGRDRMCMTSTWKRPVSRIAPKGSRSTRGCARPTRAPMQSATSPADRNLRTLPTTMPGLSSGTRCSGFPSRSTTARCPGSPIPIRSSPRSA
jgi:pyruvate/2-oxoglutarate dehydrogenase complex dihydrolipoamide dehydrogenase (E3) component